MIKVMLRTTAVAALLAALPALAAPITGTINLSGDFQPVRNGSATQNLNQATGIDFLPSGGGTGGFSTLSGTGTLKSFENRSGGTIKDFTFSPFSAVSTFYTISGPAGTLSFDLNVLSIDSQSSSFLNLSGSGILRQTGYDNTVGTFFFSGQSSNGASNNATFSWSASDQAAATATVVPEPMSLGLLGMGLLGLGMIRRRA